MTTATAVDINAPQESAFDAYAAQYEAALQNGLSLSGETSEYFARRRIAWTADLLCQQPSIHNLLDFGCGVGIATPLLQEIFRPSRILGFDPSTAAINRAQAELGSTSINFTALSDAIPSEQFDLAYCNGVFHHIKPTDRAFALSAGR
jgi:trans-aconitate methyltransferase